MSIAESPQSVAAQPNSQEKLVPLLENGDRLHAGEFLRRYESMPELKKAELIQGTVYMASPVRARDHGIPDGLIQTWLGVYAAATEGVHHATNSTVKLGPDDVPQPDGFLWKSGEGSSIDESGYLSGAPELVVEIAASSVSRDAGIKRESYLRAGVQEYLLWRVEDEEIDWWKLDEAEGDWVALEPDEYGLLHSIEFPGLVLDRAAALRLDSAAVLEALRKSLAE